MGVEPGSTRAASGFAPAAPVSVDGCAHGARLSDSQEAAVELLRYWSLLWRRRWMIGGITLAVALGVGAWARFGAIKWYRAIAVVTPVAPGEDIDRDVDSSPLGGIAGLGALFGVNGPGDNVVTAERYIAIMRSYDFGVGLVQRNRILPLIARGQAATITPWRLHMLINSRFSTEYDYRAGNLTLYFIDPDGATARKILGLYLESLRDKLRSEVTQTASVAAMSLQDEIHKTPDALLQNQLYELMARQLQREKLAQVQADFAFKVVEPPIVPDHYYLPSARAQAALFGAGVFVILCAFSILREWIAIARSQVAALSAAGGHEGAPAAPVPAARQNSIVAADGDAQAAAPIIRS